VLDVSPWLCYKSYRRSIEHTFESGTDRIQAEIDSHSKIRHSKKGTLMAIAAPFPAARIGSRTGSAGGLRLTRRGRIALVVSSTLFLLVIVMLSGRLSADAGTSILEQGRATGVVVVQPGENLWQIAKAVAPAADPRETVTAIRELNGIGDSTVVAGQSIVVPVARAS